MPPMHIELHTHARNVNTPTNAHANNRARHQHTLHALFPYQVRNYMVIALDAAAASDLRAVGANVYALPRAACTETRQHVAASV